MNIPIMTSRWPCGDVYAYKTIRRPETDSICQSDVWKLIYLLMGIVLCMSKDIFWKGTGLSFNWSCLVLDTSNSWKTDSNGSIHRLMSFKIYGSTWDLYMMWSYNESAKGHVLNVNLLEGHMIDKQYF